MSYFLNQTAPKIKSAKHWLDRAEKDFASDSPIRGELDLLLAEAELKACQEVKRPHHWTFRWTILRHMTAVIVAAVVVGASGIYWLSQNSQVYEKTTTVVPVTGLVEAPVSANKPITAATTIVPISSSSSPGQEVNSEHKAESKESSISIEDRQRLIQKANKSLRGQ